MESTIRPVTAEEYTAWFEAIERGFLTDSHAADIEARRPIVELDRTLGAFDGETVIGTAGACSFDFTVPGMTVPVAGITAVTVAATHRRRGLLTTMMRRQLTDIHDAGREPLAVLWASEPAIYGRFGYGCASWTLELTLRPATSQFARTVSSDGVRLVDRTTFLAAAAPAYDAMRPSRPGFFVRSTPWWDVRFYDPEHERGGASEYRYAVHEGPAAVDGYAVYRTKSAWVNGSPDGTVTVRELLGTPDAEAALWRFLLDHDLTTTVIAEVRPADDPLLQLLLDNRTPRGRYGDGLWVRLVDVPAALAARRYRTNGTLVVDITDELCPWNAGRWLLDGGPEGASCERTDLPADLAMAVTELGAAYLGGTSVWSLAHAGRVVELTPQAATRADLLLGWSPQPWCPQIF